MVRGRSAGIFDGVKKGFYTEEDEPNPPNHYGRSKYLGELIIKGMLENYIIIRASWIFGGGPQKDNKIVAKVIKQFSNPEIKGVTDRIGSPTYGKDFIETIKQLMENNEIGVFNIANKGSCSVYEFIREIVSILKPNIKVTPVDSSSFNLDAVRRRNISLLTKIKMRSWQEALKDYLKTEWKPFLKL